jgi:hypothetical protein
MSNNKIIQQGWECPKCGCVYSPLTMKCNVCPQSITSGTSIGVGGFGSTTTFFCTEFVKDTVNSSATKCMRCGKESWQHYKITNTLQNNEQQ